MIGGVSQCDAPHLPPGPLERIDLGANAESLSAMRRYHEQFGDVFLVRARRSDSLTCVVQHPDLVRRILVDDAANFPKGSQFSRVKLLLGNGIFTSEGAHWRAQRRKIQPCFGRDRLAACVESTRHHDDALLECWSSAGNAPVDVVTDVARSTLEKVVGAVFGARVSRYWSRYEENPFRLLVEQPGRDLAFFARFRALRPVVRELARAARQDDEGPDFLSQLVASARCPAREMSEEDLVDELLTLVVSGFETTAATLAFLWYCLAAHAIVWERVVRELDASLQAGGSLAATNAYPMCHQVVLETLRLYPPGWIFTRQARDAYSLNGHFIPGGTEIVICPYLIHRRSDCWHDPESFSPGRFATEKCRRPQGYLPFSLGARLCIGEDFAMQTAVAHLVTIGRRLRPRLRESTLNLDFAINLRPTAPLLLGFEPRDA